MLDRVTALTRPGAEETPPATVTDYQFPQANVTLTGYTLPETLNRRELPLDFWWQTAGQPQDRADLSQFLHLIPQDGDEDEIYTFDRPPFNGRFPMPAWPADMRERATLSLPLDDLPAGTYDIYTGLYDWQTNTRYTVLAEGDPVQNNAIHLGSITYDPAEIAETPARDLSVYCYAVSNFNAEQNIEVDTLIAVNRETGTAELVGSMGTQEVENLAFSQDGRVLYGIAEYKEERRGQFGTIDLETGVFTDVGAAVADPPATNPVYGPDPLFDVDGIDVDRSTGRVWAVTQDAKNYLFQVDPDTGEVVRDAFGENIDYVKVDLSSLTRADFIDVEGFSIHPETGDFYIIAASEDFDSTLARIDFDTLNPAQRTVQVTDPQPFISDQDGDPILDVEGTAFGPAGTFYITNSNNSNTRQVYDSIWQVDLETGESRWIDSMENHVPYMDYESLACYAGNTD